jgi:hypothetical protein
MHQSQIESTVGWIELSPMDRVESRIACMHMGFSDGFKWVFFKRVFQMVSDGVFSDGFFRWVCQMVCSDGLVGWFGQMVSGSSSSSSGVSVTAGWQCVSGVLVCNKSTMGAAGARGRTAGTLISEMHRRRRKKIRKSKKIGSNGSEQWEVKMRLAEGCHR